MLCFQSAFPVPEEYLTNILNDLKDIQSYIYFMISSFFTSRNYLALQMIDSHSQSDNELEVQYVVKTAV